MRRFLGVFMVGLLVLSSSCAPVGKPEPGKAAPGFSLPDIHGTVHKLSEYDDKVRLVVFWATWCPPCMQEVPSLKRLQERYGPKGLQVITLSIDDRPERVLPKFITDNSVNYLVLVSDEATEKAFGGIGSIPTAFLIDRQGKISRSYLGYTVESKFSRDIEGLL
jgi:peroxiredoxin